jgi:hypothetical protein
LIQVVIKQHSLYAKWAAKKLGSPQVAMVLGNVIHLHGVATAQFLKDKEWVRHEITHVQQFKKFGKLLFLLKYLGLSLKFGYLKNPLEVEARQSETDLPFLQQVEIISIK